MSRTAVISTIPVGALRDVVVNHLLQVVAATAMEAPAGGDPETLKDAQTALFKAVVTADPAHYVRGQYDGYRSIDGCADNSTTETFAALRLNIENWRWSGVPFFIRTGKRLPVTQTEVRLVFKKPPNLGFGLRDASSEPDQVVIKLDPSTGIRLELEARQAESRTARRDPVSTWSSPSKAARAPRPTRCSSMPRWSARPCDSRARTGWRNSGGSCSRCSTRHHRCNRTRPARGARAASAAGRRSRSLA